MNMQQQHEYQDFNQFPKNNDDEYKNLILISNFLKLKFFKNLAKPKN